MRPIPVGKTAVLEVVVRPEHLVDFDEMGQVHAVYATYTMAKHFEEAGRKLLVPHLEDGEAGIGRSVSVEHLAPSWVGDRLTITATCTDVAGGRLTVSVEAVDQYGRRLGYGTTVQVVAPESVLAARTQPPSGRNRA